MDESRIVAIGSLENAGHLAYEAAFDAREDFPEDTICPGFIDIHIHGGRGHDVMEATPAALATIGSFLATRGVAAYFPTTVTAPVDDTLRALAGLAKIIRHPTEAGAIPLGIHLEGPFISHEKRGVHPPECIQKPSIALFDRFWNAAEGTIRLMTIAPEIEGAVELIEHAARLGVRVSLGHSNADTGEAKQGIAAGAQSATHTFNAMRPLDHRDPGILGTVLDTDTLYAELICDGIHVDPAIVRLFWKARRASGRAILITDGISATGMPDGEYMLGSFRVQVSSGRALHEGHLAGSVLTLDHAVENFIAFTGAPVQDALALVTTHPAALTGAQTALAVGQPATFNVVSPTGKLVATYLHGNRVR